MIDYSILSGETNPLRDYVICMGQSTASKGVMFVFYSVLKKVSSPYSSPMCYLGVLADDLETAIINARKRCPRYQIEIWDEETFSSRKTAICSNPSTMIVDFGKYKGLTVNQIFDKDVDYLFWLANNGNFKSKYMIAVMEQYREICKEIIIIRNRKESKSALPIEDKCNVKKLIVVSLYQEDNSYYSTDKPTFKVKMIDGAGNRYYYVGTSSKFSEVKKEDTIELKCRVSGSFESMGINFNVLKTR